MAVLDCDSDYSVRRDSDISLMTNLNDEIQPSNGLGYTPTTRWEDRLISEVDAIFNSHLLAEDLQARTMFLRAVSFTLSKEPQCCETCKIRGGKENPAGCSDRSCNCHFGLDELVRDLTKVHPMSKSEARQRIQALLSKHDEELRDKIKDKEINTNDGRNIAAMAVNDGEDFVVGWNQAIGEILSLLKPQE